MALSAATAPPQLQTAKPAAETTRAASRAILHSQPTHQHPSVSSGAPPTTRDRLMGQFGARVPVPAPVPTSRDRMLLGRAIEERQGEEANAKEGEEPLVPERDRASRGRDRGDRPSPEDALQAQRRSAKEQPGTMPRPPPLGVPGTISTTEDEPPVAAEPVAEARPPPVEFAREPEPAPATSPEEASQPPKEPQAEAGIAAGAITQADEEIPASAEAVVRARTGESAAVQEGERGAPQGEPGGEAPGREREDRREEAPAEEAKESAPPGSEAGGRRTGGPAMPGASVPGAASPAGATLETRAAAIGPVPGDVSPEVQSTLSGFQAAATEQKQSIVTEVRAAQGTVTEASDTVKGRLHGVVLGIQAGLELIFGDREAQVAARGEIAQSAIAEGVTRKSADVADEQTIQGGELTEGYAAATGQLDAAGTGGAGEVRQNGEDQAQHAATYSESVAGRATEIAGGEAGRYSGEAGGDASTEASQRGEDMAVAMREQGEVIASAARDDSEGMAGDLEGATAGAVAQIGASFPLASLALSSLAGAALGGLGQLLAGAVPIMGQLYDAIVGQLAAAKESLFAALDDLDASFSALVDLAVGNATGALEVAGNERIGAVEETEQKVFGEVGGVPVDLDGELAAALADVETALADDVGEANTELSAGAERMTLDLDRGAESATTGAGLMGALGEDASAQLTGQADGGYRELESVADRNGDDLVGQFLQGISDAVNCVLTNMGPAVAMVIEAIASAVDWAARQIDDIVGDSLKEEDDGTESFATRLRDQYWEYVEEGGLVGALVVIGLAIVAILEYFAGVVWGIIKAVVSLIVGIIALIVGIIAILFLFGVFLGILLGALIDCVGVIPAIIITLIVAVIGLVLIALALVVGILVGIVMVIVSIFTNIWQAFTDPTLSPFRRGDLIGQAIADIVLLLLPFKGKLKFRLPGRLGLFLESLGREGRVLARILRALGGDVGLLVRLYRLVGRDLVVLEELLGLVRNGARLAELLEAQGMTVTLLRELLGLFGNDAVRLAELLRLVGRDATLLRSLLRLAGEDVTLLRQLLANTGDDAVLLRRIFSLCGDDLAVVRDLMRRTGNDGRLLAELLEAVAGDTARLNALLDLADNPTQLRLFLQGVTDLAELERLLIVMRDSRIPLSDIEFLIRDRGMGSLDALRLVEGLLTERGRITRGTEDETRAILQALREGTINIQPRRARPGEPDIDFILDRGPRGGPPGFVDIKTPVIPRFRPLAAQAADIARSTSVLVRDGNTQVIVDLRNLGQAEKAQFLDFFAREMAALGEDLDALVRGGRVIIQNGPI